MYLCRSLIKCKSFKDEVIVDYKKVITYFQKSLLRITSIKQSALVTVFRKISHYSKTFVKSLKMLNFLLFLSQTWFVFLLFIGILWFQEMVVKSVFDAGIYNFFPFYIPCYFSHDAAAAPLVIMLRRHSISQSAMTAGLYWDGAETQNSVANSGRQHKEHQENLLGVKALTSNICSKDRNLLCKMFFFFYFLVADTGQRATEEPTVSNCTAEWNWSAQCPGI